ncbi:MAG TPA: cold-shock protein [Luteibacter sp.]|uniref:cold-shock protein n=1 Tax=Luteibacter sp. TaxID=1886636 RepID=UPI002C417979|nr:cold-shock protein [Luteibacter sp.]HVI54217.1 cold-shock protein [Luteibacter sp.]
MGMQQGTVKWFNVTKGFGVVAPDDGGEDAIVVSSDIQGTGDKALKEGDRVSFEIEKTAKGSAARNVAKIASS